MPSPNSGSRGGCSPFWLPPGRSRALPCDFRRSIASSDRAAFVLGVGSRPGQRSVFEIVGAIHRGADIAGRTVAAPLRAFRIVATAPAAARRTPSPNGALVA